MSLCGPISISRANAHMVHMGYKTSVTLLYEELLETFNDLFVLLKCNLVSFDCVIIKIPFWLVAQRVVLV